MTQIEYKSEGPVNDLLLAINHYVSTGDHIGEGVALPEPGGRVLVQIPYDPRGEQDADDFRRFTARMAEIGAADPTLAFPVRELGHAPGFTVAGFSVPEGDMRRLARELVRSGGQAGWGIGETVIAEHFPEVRAVLLSGEGV